MIDALNSSIQEMLEDNPFMAKIIVFQMKQLFHQMGQCLPKTGLDGVIHILTLQSKLNIHSKQKFGVEFIRSSLLTLIRKCAK